MLRFEKFLDKYEDPIDLDENSVLDKHEYRIVGSDNENMWTLSYHSFDHLLGVIHNLEYQVKYLQDQDNVKSGEISDLREEIQSINEIRSKEMSDLETEIDNLGTKINELELALKYIPGGSEYQTAEEHFSNLQISQNPD